MFWHCRTKHVFKNFIILVYSSPWCIVGEPYRQKPRSLWRREPRISPAGLRQENL